MRIFIVGGSPEARRPSNLAPGAADYVIAADRGAQHARAWGWPIHLLVGDLDSLPPEVAAATEAEGTLTLQAPAEKDETDMELALGHALAAKPDEILICGGLGGRTDHLLANVLLLARQDMTDLGVTLADGPEAVRLLRGPTTADAAPARLALSGTPGDLVSLLPLGGNAIGVSTCGLRYPLEDETLFHGSARGISNILTRRRAEIILRCGTLVIIHITTEAGPIISGNFEAPAGGIP